MCHDYHGFKWEKKSLYFLWQNFTSDTFSHSFGYVLTHEVIMEDNEHKLTKAINNDIYKSFILCPSSNVERSLSWKRFCTFPMSTFANTLDYILPTKLRVSRLEMLARVNTSLEEVKQVTSNAKLAFNVLYSCNHY